MNALDGLEDLPTQPQCGADAECSPVHAAPQVRQVPTLTRTHDTSHICEGIATSDVCGVL